MDHGYKDVILIMIKMIITKITCDKGSFLVEILCDAIQAGEVDDSQTKTFNVVQREYLCRKQSLQRDL